MYEISEVQLIEWVMIKSIIYGDEFCRDVMICQINIIIDIEVVE